MSRAWQLTYDSDPFSSAFGQSFDLLNDVTRNRFIERANSDEYFAQGVVTAFAQRYSKLTDILKNMFWDNPT